MFRQMTASRTSGCSCSARWLATACSSRGINCGTPCHSAITEPAAQPQAPASRRLRPACSANKKPASSTARHAYRALSDQHCRSSTPIKPACPVARQNPPGACFRLHGIRAPPCHRLPLGAPHSQNAATQPPRTTAERVAAARDIDDVQTRHSWDLWCNANATCRFRAQLARRLAHAPRPCCPCPTGTTQAQASAAPPSPRQRQLCFKRASACPMHPTSCLPEPRLHT